MRDAALYLYYHTLTFNSISELPVTTESVYVYLLASDRLLM